MTPDDLHDLARELSDRIDTAEGLEVCPAAAVVEITTND